MKAKKLKGPKAKVQRLDKIPFKARAAKGFAQIPMPKGRKVR